MNVLVRILAAALLCAATAVPAPAGGAEPYPWDLDNGREAALIGAGGAMLGLGWLKGREGPRLTPAELAALDPADLPVWDRGATRRWSPAASRASDLLLGGMVVGPVALALTPPGAERGGRLGLIYGETMLLTWGATSLLKSAVGRPRPYAYNPDPRIPPELRTAPTTCRSFPSGHAASAFAAAVFTAGTFERLNPDSPARGWVWAGCLGAAATTGVLRWVAGRHFPSDILAGAAVGATAGWLVPRLHETGAGPGGPAAAPAAVTFGFAF